MHLTMPMLAFTLLFLSLPMTNALSFTTPRRSPLSIRLFSTADPSPSSRRVPRLLIPDNDVLFTSAVEEGVTSIYNDDGTLNQQSGDASVYQEAVPQEAPQDYALNNAGEPDPRALIFKYVIPVVGSVAAVVGGTLTGTRAFVKRQNNLVDRYANEMVYHSADEQEMSACHKDFKRKLGPGQKRKQMLQKYLELFIKKKVVTAASITSLSYVLSLFNLNDIATATLMCDTASDMRKQPASRGKLLFFGERIINSPEGRRALQPIRDMLASNYRSGGEEIVEMAQTTMARTAYKAAVVAGGETGGDVLTPGYEILGLDEAEAREISDEAREEGFESDALSYYKYQSVVPEYSDDGTLAIDAAFKDDEDVDYYADLSESMKMARGLIDGKGKKLYDKDGKIIKKPDSQPPAGDIYECDDDDNGDDE